MLKVNNQRNLKELWRHHKTQHILDTPQPINLTSWVCDLLFFTPIKWDELKHKFAVLKLKWVFCLSVLTTKIQLVSLLHKQKKTINFQISSHAKLKCAKWLQISYLFAGSRSLRVRIPMTFFFNTLHNPNILQKKFHDPTQNTFCARIIYTTSLGIRRYRHVVPLRTWYGI